MKAFSLLTIGNLRIGAIGTIATFFVLLLSVLTNAAYAGDGTIYGTVYSTYPGHSEPLAGTEVILRSNYPDIAPEVTTATDMNGDYRFNNLKRFFKDHTGCGGSLINYWITYTVYVSEDRHEDYASDGLMFGPHVFEIAHDPLSQFIWQGTGTISGYVRDGYNNEGIAGVAVELSWYDYYGVGHIEYNVVTDENGYYEVTDVQRYGPSSEGWVIWATYHVRLDQVQVGQLGYDPDPTALFASAPPFSATVFHVEQAFSLERGPFWRGSMSGNVSDSLTGDPLDGVAVILRAQERYGHGYPGPEDQVTTTDVNGDYEFHDVQRSYTFSSGGQIGHEIYNLHISEEGYEDYVSEDLPFSEGVYDIVHDAALISTRYSIGDDIILDGPLPAFSSFDAPQVISDDRGGVVSVWELHTTTPHYGSGSDVLSKTSLDFGATWPGQKTFISAPQSVPSVTNKDAQLGQDDRGNIYAVWLSAGSGPGDNLLSRHSADNGATWSDIVPVAVPPLYGDSPVDSSMTPAICNDNSGHVYVVWKHLFTEELNISRSFDYGQTWEDILVGPAPEWEEVDIACDNSGHVYIIHKGFEEVTYPTGYTGNEERVIVRRSSNYGVDWDEVAVLGTHEGGWTDIKNIQISVSMNSETVVVVWQLTTYAPRSGTSGSVYANASDDYGDSWQEVENNISKTYGEDVSAQLGRDQNDNVFVTWLGYAGHVYFVRSRDGGLNWDEKVVVHDGTFEDQADLSMPQYLCHDDSGHLYVIWYARWPDDIFLSYSLDYGITWDRIPVADSTVFEDPAIACDSFGNVHIVGKKYTEEFDPGGEYYMVYLPVKITLPLVVSIVAPESGSTVPSDGFPFYGFADAIHDIDEIRVSVLDAGWVGRHGGRGRLSVYNRKVTYVPAYKLWGFMVQPEHITSGSQTILAVKAKDKQGNWTPFNSVVVNVE